VLQPQIAFQWLLVKVMSCASTVFSSGHSFLFEFTVASVALSFLRCGITYRRMEEVETLIQQRQKQTTSESHKAKMAGLSKRTVAFVATDQIEIGKEEL
jgi:hypothetical protein